MSQKAQRIVLDNTVVSNLQKASALNSVLAAQPGLFVVTRQVRDEAQGWKAQGLQVVSILDRLVAETIIELATVEPGAEGVLFTHLQRTRGQGESASIAIAHNRGYIVATDDYQAKRSCVGLNPPVVVLATEDALSMMVRDGLLSPDVARAIWAAVGISDPKRDLSL